MEAEQKRSDLAEEEKLSKKEMEEKRLEREAMLRLKNWLHN